MRFLNCDPRSYTFSNISKEAAEGDMRTIDEMLGDSLKFVSALFLARPIASSKDSAVIKRLS